MKNSLKDKVVIITGASSGIGKALAIQLAKKCVKIVLSARNIKNLKDVEMLVKQAGGVAISVPTDVTKKKDCKNLITKTIDEFNQLDILINNAGIAMRALFVDTKIEVIEKLMTVNFWGTIYCAKYALPYLLKTKGSLVNVNSIAGYIGLPARSGYSASKYAVRGFYDTLRIEHKKDSLHVLVACPGFTKSNIRNTALNEIGDMQKESPRNENKMMSAQTCAKYIIKAIEKRKREVVLTFWEGKFTVWLKKWFPSLLDKLIYMYMLKEKNAPLRKNKKTI